MNISLIEILSSRIKKAMRHEISKEYKIERLERVN